MQQKMEKFKLIKPSKEYEGQAVEYIMIVTYTIVLIKFIG